jgi:hypothetical protein
VRPAVREGSRDRPAAPPPSRVSRVSGRREGDTLEPVDPPRRSFDGGESGKEPGREGDPPHRGLGDLCLPRVPFQFLSQVLGFLPLVELVLVFVTAARRTSWGCHVSPIPPHVPCPDSLSQRCSRDGGSRASPSRFPLPPFSPALAHRVCSAQAGRPHILLCVREKSQPEPLLTGYQPVCDSEPFIGDTGFCQVSLKPGLSMGSD